MKVLTIGHRKMDTLFLDISTSEKEVAAFLFAFIKFDDEWGFYYDLEDECNAEDSPDNWKLMREWYDTAKNAGLSASERSGAARSLMEYRKRRGYEYEDEWNIVKLTDPLVELTQHQQHLAG